jgi:hypothetical protein
LAQRGQPRLGEEGSRHAPVRLDLYQTAGHRLASVYAASRPTSATRELLAADSYG